MAQTSACPNCQCSMLLPELSLGARESAGSAAS